MARRVWHVPFAFHIAGKIVDEVLLRLLELLSSEVVKDKFQNLTGAIPNDPLLIPRLKLGKRNLKTF